ncbi:MAG: VCBS repeat-containing protein, partial [Spirochaetales bacterium]|nr:VCBS repeat-containing protein [Spirochaetales bacterium]
MIHVPARTIRRGRAALLPAAAACGVLLLAQCSLDDGSLMVRPTHLVGVFLVPMSEANQTHSVALGDVDDDGDLDLVVGDYDQPTRIWLNDGRGMFADSGQVLREFPMPEAETSFVALADLDNDGDLDLVECTFPWGVFVYRNSG